MTMTKEQAASIREFMGGRSSDWAAGAYDAIDAIASSADVVVPAPSGALWSLVRRVLDQGTAIQQDYAAGKYPSYEHLSARLDEAARERCEQFAALLRGPTGSSEPPAPTPGANGPHR